MNNKLQIKALKETVEDLGKDKENKEKANTSWLMRTIKSIVSSTTKIPNPSPFKFENSLSAAKENFEILKQDKFKFSNDILSLGST